MNESPHEIYRQMFECSPIPHLLINADTLEIVDANPAAVDFYGYSRPQLTTLLELCLHSREEILALINQQDCMSFRSLHRHRLGMIRDVDVFFTKFQHDTRHLLLLNVFDVTAQRQRERSLQSVAQNFPNGAIVLFDHDLRYLLADGAGLPDAGLNKADIEGKTLYEVFPPETVAFIEPHYRKALAGEESHQEVPYAGRVYAVYYRPVRDENNRVVAGLAITQDVSLNKQMERALRESEELYRSLVSTMGEGVVMYDCDGYIVMCNTRACQILGLEPDQLKGRTSIDPSWHTIRKDGEPFPGLEHPALVTLKTGQPQRNVIMGVHKPDESWSWISINSEPLMREGQVHGVVVSFSDVTEREMAEEKFEKVFRVNPDAIYIRSLRDDRILAVNEAYLRLSGYQEEEVVGHFSQELNLWVHPHERALVRLLLMEQGEVRDFEAMFRRKDGSIVVGLLSAHKIDLGGEPCLLTITRDISAYKRLEQQKVEFELQTEKLRLLRQFLGDVSHDLKTPLATINVALYVLQKSSDERKKAEQIHILELAAERLESMLDDLLMMLRLDAGVDFEYEQVDVNLLVRGLLAKHRLLSERKEQVVEFLPHAESLMLKIDKVYLRQALRNILVNAQQYTPQGGHIRVRTYQEQRTVVIEVSDNGPGIAASQLPHIFERFYRADQARGSEEGGMGLGLTIAQKIIEAHQGEIEVESQVGRGSTFRLRLPVLLNLYK